MEYLNSKYESVGRREMAGMMVRMMAPVGGLVARAIRWGDLLAALGLGSAAIFSAERKDKDPAQRNQCSGKATRQFRRSQVEAESVGAPLHSSQTRATFRGPSAGPAGPRYPKTNVAG